VGRDAAGFTALQHAVCGSVHSAAKGDEDLKWGYGVWRRTEGRSGIIGAAACGLGTVEACERLLKVGGGCKGPFELEGCGGIQARRNTRSVGRLRGGEG
jgi:hypothetical protein